MCYAQVITFKTSIKGKNMEEKVGTKDNRPALTTEEYAELRNMQAQQTFLQSQGYQAFNYIKQLEMQFEDLTRNFELQKKNAQEQLDKVEEELQRTNENFQLRFKDIITSYGFDGATSVNIEETEPHYISVIQNPQPFTQAG